MNNRGNRSGRERSSPTWGHGCRGVTGRRKPVDLAHGYEGPPSEFPLPIHIPPGGGEPSGFVGGGFTSVGAACTAGAGVWLSV